MWWWWWAACGAPEDCGPAECAAVCPPAPDPTAQEPGGPSPTVAPEPAASAFEQAFVAPLFDEVRAGVRPWDEQAVGVCEGKKDCGTFLGTNPGQLPKGDYVVKAELRVPPIGDKGTWKVRFQTECRTPKAGGEPVVQTYDRTYDVWYVGPDRGLRLTPLRTIESPAKGGPQTCTFTLTALHPAGDRTTSGGWSTL